MEKKRSNYTSSDEFGKDKPKAKETSRKAKGDCMSAPSSSHTQFVRKVKYDVKYENITVDEYLGLSESISGSEDSYRCVHGPEGKQYTEKGKLKQNILKELDPIPTDKKWTDVCPPAYGWDMARKLEFMVLDPTAPHLRERIEAGLRDFAKISSRGYKIDTLDSVCSILNYLLENQATYHECFLLLLDNMTKPILLNVGSDVIKHYENIKNYIGFMIYVSMRLEDDRLFDIVSRALIWHLTAPDKMRCSDAAPVRYTVAAAGPVVYQTTVRMIAVATSHRFPTYLRIALILACDSVDNCIAMMKESIIENIFYRFNPYFPDRKLPVYDINPADPQDFNVKLGDSSVHMTITLSLLLVLVKTTMEFLDENPKYRGLLPCPDEYAQRCFIWAYRYECRVQEHRHQRITLTVFASVLARCFGECLTLFSSHLMQDVMKLSVLTELPPRDDWTQTVNFTTGQLDVQFKKVLIYTSVEFLKLYPLNKQFFESLHWVVGLMYLLDPGLCYLRPRWSLPLFAELRKTAMQALVCALPLCTSNLTKDCGLIRRIMWYIEWYSESPYELSVLYWSLRLLRVALHHRGEPEREMVIRDLYNTHGIIVLIRISYTLLEQKLPPVEKSQVIIGLCLRLLTSGLVKNVRVSCCVYPEIKWPSSLYSLARKMLDVTLHSLERQFIISDRWLISTLRLIWQAVIWKDEYRRKFVADNGIFKLLDMVTMTRAPVQCMALAMVCDTARDGGAVGQLVTWRASIGASKTYPNVVKRGATISTLMAAIFRDECQATGVRLNVNGIIEDIDYPLMSLEGRIAIESNDFKEPKSIKTPICLAAADLAGSRMSKVFSLLHLLSEDLDYKVTLADEVYRLYKDIQLAPEDEAILVLCSHFLTIKLNEVWIETKIQTPDLLPQDDDILEEFLHIGRGHAKQIMQQQEDVINKDRNKEHEAESSLYAFLGRVRLNMALDALREVRCVARSADRARILNSLLNDAVRAHHRRSVCANKYDISVIRTYKPMLDNQNLIGQNVKVFSVHGKDKPRTEKVGPSYQESEDS